MYLEYYVLCLTKKLLLCGQPSREHQTLWPDFTGNPFFRFTMPQHGTPDFWKSLHCQSQSPKHRLEGVPCEEHRTPFALWHGVSRPGGQYVHKKITDDSSQHFTFWWTICVLHKIWSSSATITILNGIHVRNTEQRRCKNPTRPRWALTNQRRLLMLLTHSRQFRLRSARQAFPTYLPRQYVGNAEREWDVVRQIK